MRGRRIPLSRARRLVIDFLHFAAAIPTVPVQRRVHLRPVIDARAALLDRPPWSAIFTKAFAVVSAEFPELRRAFVKLPWHHLYEYPKPVAASPSSAFDGDKAVLCARIKDPGSLSLAEITRRVRSFCERPIGEIKDFRRALRMCRYPRFARRALWWLGLNHPLYRIRHFGTFGVSVYSALGAESLHPLSPLTTILNYGVFTEDGDVDVRVVYDHRVMDGAIVARALARLEEVLTGPIMDELRSMSEIKASRAA